MINLNTINEMVAEIYRPALLAEQRERSVLWDRFMATVPKPPIHGPTRYTLEVMLERQCRVELEDVLARYNATIVGDEYGDWGVQVDTRQPSTTPTG